MTAILKVHYANHSRTSPRQLFFAAVDGHIGEMINLGLEPICGILLIGRHYQYNQAEYFHIFFFLNLTLEFLYGCQCVYVYKQKLLNEFDAVLIKLVLRFLGVNIRNVLLSNKIYL